MAAVPIRVLLVEDDDAYAALIGAELAAAAPEICLTRVNMLAHAASVSSQPFDAVLLDLELPDGSGIQTVERGREVVGDVPIVVLTSRDDETLALGSVQRGAQDYIVKQHATGPLLARAIRYAIERAVFQRTLLESEARRSAIVDASLDGIVTIDARGIITDFNPAAGRMFKRTRAEAIGFELGGLIVPPDYRDAHRAGLASYPHGRLSAIIGRRTQTEGMCSDGTKIPIELSVVELPSSAGHRMFTASLRDLSEQRKTEEALRISENQLRQALKMEAIGRLAGGVAHDFNNVLTAIFGYTDLLLDQCGPDDPKRADLEEIHKSAERAATLTRQLLAFSRKQILQPKVLSLNGVITGMQSLLSRLIGDDVRLQIHAADELWPVRADKGQLEQVLMNLAANARDAMPEGGDLTMQTMNVTVTVEDLYARPGLKSGDYARMDVSDTGEGMPESVYRHIFEPFFTTKEQGKGTGLGLATVYGIVKQSGGGVYVDSLEGKGTRFEIYLPRVP